MPYSVFERLRAGEVKPINVTLQLADRSVKYPRGIMQDTLVKVENFYLTINFLVLDMEEDVEVPLLLEMLFLKTTGALIDVKEEKMTLRVGDEKVVFDISKSMKRPLGVR
ncbi:hypothetical protein Dsin_024922 [Dipteronia sinensis]|uniref:Uncharacterized protein n=1 Tax=Dipteronia sinensis TaxID=43782 RepID=A0AAD9ZUW1_9ROSI|nr:hypothetical protein Dsin_024922 [Dipteronia sinensis]